MSLYIVHHSAMMLQRRPCTIPDTDDTREEGEEMRIHCRLWDEQSHVMTSGSSCWYQEWCDGDSNQSYMAQNMHLSICNHYISLVTVGYSGYNNKPLD